LDPQSYFLVTPDIRLSIKKILFHRARVPLEPILS
jgi:hypothetical protein